MIRDWVRRYCDALVVAILGVDVALLISRPFTPWAVLSIVGGALYLIARARRGPRWMS